jgi:hypothetical protein
MRCAICSRATLRTISNLTLVEKELRSNVVSIALGAVLVAATRAANISTRLDWDQVGLKYNSFCGSLDSALRGSGPPMPNLPNSDFRKNSDFDDFEQKATASSNATIRNSRCAETVTAASFCATAASNNSDLEGASKVMSSQATNSSGLLTNAAAAVSSAIGATEATVRAFAKESSPLFQQVELGNKESKITESVTYAAANADAQKSTAEIFHSEI